MALSRKHNSWHREAGSFNKVRLLQTHHLEHLPTVHAVTRMGNKTQAIKRSPLSARHIFRSLNLHGIYEHSQGKQKVERESEREESSWCGGVSLFHYGLHMSGGKCSFYPSKAQASATKRISLPEWNLPCSGLTPSGEWQWELRVAAKIYRPD